MDPLETGHGSLGIQQTTLCEPLLHMKSDIHICCTCLYLFIYLWFIQ